MSQDLSKGKIDFNDEIYVGSTCDTLVKRFSAHKWSIYSEKTKHRPLYTLMREIGFNRFRIELIEEYPCADKYQLRQRDSEGYYIRQIGTFNQLVSGRTREEVEKIYFENNREKIKQELIMKKIKK